MTTRNEDMGSRPTAVQPSAASNSAATMVNTTEIPVVENRATRTRDGRYEDDWYHGAPRRTPAPVGLRIAVWLLFFLFVLALIGLAIEHYHPSWIGFLRETTSLRSSMRN